MSFYQEIVTLLEKGKTGVVATLVARSGSGARKVGSKMLITDSDATMGSLGGGLVDATVISRAREVLLSGEPLLLRIEPDLEGKDVCGSAVQVFLEPVSSTPGVVIIGAGHVGRATASIAGLAGFRVVLADDRPCEETGVDSQCCLQESFFQEIPVQENTAVIICTRSHALDFTVLEQALATPAGFIGLLGSRRKRESFFDRLRKSGLSSGELSRIITPVGLDIGADTPEEIGVSIVAQLVERSKHLNPSG